MIVLGIESTCDETAAALVEDGRHLLSNVISTSVKEQALYGGVVPEIASRRHCEFISATVKKALLDAGKTIDDVDAVAVTFAPGLIGAVLVGVNFAKGLAYSANKPLVPVHHLRGHIAALYLTHPELKPPFLCLALQQPLAEVEKKFRQPCRNRLIFFNLLILWTFFTQSSYYCNILPGPACYKTCIHAVMRRRSDRGFQRFRRVPGATVRHRGNQ